MIMSIPPMKDAPVSAKLDLQNRAVTVSPFTSTWVQWLTELFHAIEVLALAGTTAQRPNPAPAIGCTYFDTTLGRPIWAKTLTVWVDASGTPL